MISGIAGALFVPQVGIITPANMGIVPSIEMVIWVAVGGRGTLIGPIIGAVLVNGAKSGLSESFPDFWQYFFGALFIGRGDAVPGRHRRSDPPRACRDQAALPSRASLASACRPLPSRPQ